MKEEVVKIVVCGEVDHGKSTLLGRVLYDTRSLPDGRWAELKRVCRQMGKDVEPAFLLDQFKEEREEERTIDTTQIFIKTKKRRYCLIDTPGHIEFIKNMMTGATQAEAAVLVIDVTEGIQEQTLRHVRLLKMLGISQIILAVNKMDLVGFNQKKFETVRDGARAFLKQIGVSCTAIIPIAAKEGHNISRFSAQMKWYRGLTIVKSLDSIRAVTITDSLPLRFPVQDIYLVDGESVCVGRVESGCVKAGQSVIVFPSGRKTKINIIKVFGGKKKTARADENIGLVLSEPGLRRGEIICSRGKRPLLLKHFEGYIFWFAQKPLKINDALILRCATQEAKGAIVRVYERMNSATCEVLEKDGREIKVNELARVMLETQAPLVMENFCFIESLGRFVLEANGKALGVGVVLKEKNHATLLDISQAF